MMLLLRAATFLCAALCSHAARAERHDGIAEAIAQKAAPPWGKTPEATGETPMALPDGLKREDFPALGSAKKEEAVTVSTTAPAAAKLEAVTVSTTAPAALEDTPADEPVKVHNGHKVIERTPAEEAKAEAAADEKVEEKLEEDIGKSPTGAANSAAAAANSPAAETPAAETPAAETPAAETPASATSVHADHFQKTVDQTSQIKDAVERVHVKTQAAKAAAVAVKGSFGNYQSTITDLKSQLDGVDVATHKFEGELLEHLTGEESARLQPFEDYQPQFGGAAGAEQTDVPEVTSGDVEKPVSNENATADSFLESGRRARQAKATAAADDTTVTDPPMALPGDLKKEDFPPLGSDKKVETTPKAEPTPKAKEETTPKAEPTPKVEASGSGATGEAPVASGGNRFEKSVTQSAQIKVAVGKVQEKVELTKQAAVKVKEGFTDYKEKVVEMKKQMEEVDKQQHAYHEKLLNHFDGEEDDRMSAFANPPSLESEGVEESGAESGAAASKEAASTTTAAESGLLQARERQQLSKEHVKVNAGGSFHAARH